jgi:hypothetical protein
VVKANHTHTRDALPNQGSLSKKGMDNIACVALANEPILIFSCERTANAVPGKNNIVNNAI